MTGGAGALFWLLVSVVLFIIEGIAFQLVSVWFAVGALLAMVAAALGANLVGQLLVFLVASIIFLAVGRKLFWEKLQTKKVATNADQVIGQTGIVRESVDNEQQQGRVAVGGLDWTARTDKEGIIIPVDSRVRILRIEGVKLIVEPLHPLGKESEGE